MANQVMTIKLNRFTSYLQQPTYITESPTASPNDFITLFLFHLNQWLASLLNLWPSSETRGRWLDEAGHWLAIAAPFVVVGALLICILWCCLPPILSCLAWVLVTIFNLIKGFLMMLFNLVKGFLMMLFNGVKIVFRCLFCCGKSSVKMMKAPGRGGQHFMPRGVFEANPASYFQALRAGASIRLS